MKKLLYIIMLTLPMIFVACDNDDVVGASAPEDVADFPQGDHDYDREFVSFKDKYGSIVLYKFTESQFRWAFTEYIPYYGTMGDESNVAIGWSLVKEGLSVWPESFLQSRMPFHIILADSVYRKVDGYDENWNTIKVKKVQNSCYGYNHIAFGVVNNRLDPNDLATRKQMVGDVAYALIGYAVSKNKLEIPESFDTLFTRYKDHYSTSMATKSDSYVNEWGYNGAGTLEGSAEIDQYTVYHDFALFVKYMVMMSPETFEEQFLNENFDCGGFHDSSWTTFTPEHPVRRKYEAVRDYFKNVVGIDLGAIGNRVEQMQ